MFSGTAWMRRVYCGRSRGNHPVITGGQLSRARCAGRRAWDSQLQQVVLNLLVNACDAMAADSHGEKRLTIQTTGTATGGVELSVADQGTGIPPNEMERVSSRS